MFVGPQWLDQRGVIPLTDEEAYAKIKLLGDGYPDF
jgi:hypothetical protein